jgi:hypothetical protein
MTAGPYDSNHINSDKIVFVIIITFVGKWVAR